MDALTRLEQGTRFLLWVLSPEVSRPQDWLYYAVPIGLVVALLVWWRPRGPARRWRLAWLLTLVIPWVLIGVLSGAYQHSLSAAPAPSWVSALCAMLVFFELAFLPLWVFVMRGARRFSATIGIVNLVLTLWVWFWGGQALSGIWL